MIRIISIKDLMEEFDFNPELTTTLYANIEDKYITDNDGLWRFKIENGKCSATKIDEKITNDQILNFSIDEFSQIVVGVTNIRSLTEIRNESIPEVWLNDQLFPTVPCMLGIWF
jgi:hypothetical protein